MTLGSGVYASVCGPFYIGLAKRIGIVAMTSLSFVCLLTSVPSHRFPSNIRLTFGVDRDRAVSFT